MEKVVRIIYLNEEDDLIVKDELVTGEKEALVTWIYGNTGMKPKDQHRLRSTNGNWDRT